MSQTQSRLTDLGRTSHVICLRTKHFLFAMNWTRSRWLNTVGPVTGSESDSRDRSETWRSPCEPASEPSEEQPWVLLLIFLVAFVSLALGWVCRVVREDQRLSFGSKGSHLGGNKTPPGGQSLAFSLPLAASPFLPWFYPKKRLGIS